MPRWNASRPRPDHSFRQGGSPEDIFNGTLRNWTAGLHLCGWHGRAFPFEVNAYLIELFAGHDSLKLADMIAVAQRRSEAFGWGILVTMDYVANRVGCGLHVGVLVESQGADGERIWAMPDREMRYAIVGRRMVQIRGLPPAEQHAMDRRLQNAAKREKAAAQRHADRIAPDLATDLGAIIEADCDVQIPGTWSPDFVPADIVERWPKIRAAFGLLIDVHRDWDKGRQDTWRAMVARTLVETRSRVVAERAAQAVLDAVLDAALAEDAGAFEDMGDL